MSGSQRHFGRRTFRAYHGAIQLSARCRLYCSVVRRVNRVIYLEIAEFYHIPFSFRIVFDYDGTWIDCEFKSQKGNMIVAQMIAASFDADEAAGIEKPAARLAINPDDLDAWRGPNKSSRL